MNKCKVVGCKSLAINWDDRHYVCNGYCQKHGLSLFYEHNKELSSEKDGGKEE